MKMNRLKIKINKIGLLDTCVKKKIKKNYIIGCLSKELLLQLVKKMVRCKGSLNTVNNIKKLVFRNVICRVL